MAVVWMLTGLVALVFGAEGLVRGGSRLARRVGISPLTVGLTVVAFGTSAPELAVSTRAALAGSSAVAVGNVVGSNIFNILAILGLSATIVPLGVSVRLVRIDVPLMIGCTGILLLLARTGRVGAVEGACLLLGFAVYTLWMIGSARRGPDATSAGGSPPPVGGRLRELGLVVAGLAALVIGAGWLVDGATVVARSAGISEHVIGLTVVATGTSLPEAATSVVASLRGERDIAVGNVVGSNIFNVLVVVGLPAVLAPAGLAVDPIAAALDIPVALAASAACLPVLFTGFLIHRWEGALFGIWYTAYTTLLLLSATGALDDTPAKYTLWLTLPFLGIVFTHAAIVVLRSRSTPHTP